VASGLRPDTPLAGGGSAVPEVPGMGRGGLSSAINVTPMIDVMLVLLIIFMVVTPILTQYEATPPTALTARPEPDDDIVTLGIDTRGAFFVENDPVPDAEVVARLREALADEPAGERLLYLRADRGVAYSRVLDAVEAARKAGVTTLGAITVPQDETAEAGRD
jgi:biopolymer transport protein ExbD